MTKDKLPAYFRDYLDERFKNVSDKIDELSNDVSEVKITVDGLKKKMDGVESQISGVQSQTKSNDGSIGGVSKMLKGIIIALTLIAVSLALHIGGSEGGKFFENIIHFLV